MAYIGKQPTIGNFVKLDAITTSATATYNLLNGGVAYSPQSPNHCIVSLNGVIQSPTTSFTISGSTIVFTSALTATDVIDFILVLGDVLNIGTPSDNTVSLAKLTATGTKDSTTFLRGDNTFQTIGANTPAFFATMSADQNGVADSTFTKVQFNSERFDTNSAYDPTTNYRFTVPTGQGGKYFFSSTLFIQAAGGQDFDALDYAFYINGAQNLYSGYAPTFNEVSLNVSVNGLFNLSAGDYVEMFIYGDITAGGTFNINQDTTTKARCFWYGYKIIE